MENKDREWNGRNPVKLGELAGLHQGIRVPLQERKEHGDYLIIKAQYIYDRAIHLGKGHKEFCTREFVDSNDGAGDCVLKKGDILICLRDNFQWAFYTGDDDFAVANQNIAVIRGKKETERWLRLFFTTHAGSEYLQEQLRSLYNACAPSHLSVKNLANIVLPGEKIMKAAGSLQEAVTLQARACTLFRELGWDVVIGYEEQAFYYDLALFFNQELKGIVEVRSYRALQLQENPRIIEQLQAIKHRVKEAAVYLFVNDAIYEWTKGGLEQLAELPRPDRSAVARKEISSAEEDVTLQEDQGDFEEDSLVDRVLLEIATRGEEIQAALDRIESKVDAVAEKLEKLSGQISTYQSLTSRQLEQASSSEEEERILHAFSEECTDRIVRELNIREMNREYQNERKKLVLSLGESAWKKMEDSSHSFLISAKVIFNSLVSLNDIVDYSGVCLLVTKALEVEMGKRFCTNFLAYLKNKYPGKAGHQMYPTALRDQHGKPIRPKQFTLGSLAYILCSLQDPKLTPEEMANNQERLLEYAREKLFAGKSDQEIMEILSNYADEVESIKTDYRNPSAHTNKVRRVDAEQCFALVLDVEKLLKKMLDSFDE